MREAFGDGQLELDGLIPPQHVDEDLDQRLLLLGFGVFVMRGPDGRSHAFVLIAQHRDESEGGKLDLNT